MSDLLFEVKDGVGRMTINRPDRRNALNEEVLAGIRDAAARADADPSIRLLVLTGAGDKVFSSGGDMSSMPDLDGFGPAAAYFARASYSDTLKALSGCMVPTIGAANGHVLAGAMGLFLCCDLTCAVETARFGLPEVNVGLFPMMVMSVLFKNVGRKRAMEMILLGDRISAAQALDYGILNRVFPAGTYENDLEDFIALLADRPGIVVRLGKAAFNAVEGIDPEDVELLQVSLGNVMQTEDFNEGVTAFLEKRDPEWKHR